MPASLVPLGFLTFWDANGDPLAGGSVGYYDPAAPGVLKAIWANSTQTVPLTNPVPLDAAGRPQTGGSEVSIYGTGQYRMIVNNLNGALQWSALTDSPLSTSGGTVNGDFTVIGTFLNTGNTQITGNLTVNGTSTLQRVVISSGSASLEDVFISHSLAVPGLLSAVDINASGNIQIGGYLQVFGADSSGDGVSVTKNLLVAGSTALEGTLTTGNGIDVTGPNAAVFHTEVQGDLNAFFKGQVNALGPMSASAFNVVSDRRLKTIRESGASTLACINGIPVRHGSYNTEPHVLKPMILADEIQKVMPWAVNGAPDAIDADGKPIYQSVSTMDLIIALIGAVKELQSSIGGYQDRIKALESLVTYGRPAP